MDRTAVFVDAGYLYAQGSVLLTGTKQRREFLTLSIPDAVTAIKDLVSNFSGLPLLRIYWYDAIISGSLSREQIALAHSADIKMRLGQVNSAGEQKGVDALIVTDMIDLARNHSIADAILISGDEDVRVGVSLAQQFGVRVHLAGIEPARSNQSQSLVQEADSVSEWNLATIRAFLSYTPPVAPTPAAVVATAAALDVAVNTLIAALDPAELSTLRGQFQSNTNKIAIPQVHDTALLRVGRSHFGKQALDGTERSDLRSAFVRLVLAT